MANVNLRGSETGVAILQAGTPESLGTVIDRWMEAHAQHEIMAIDIQVVASGTSPFTLMVIFRKPDPPPRR